MTKKKQISLGSQGTSKLTKWREKLEKKREPQKKKSVAFKATPSIPKNEKDMDEDGEDEFSMIVRKVGRMFYK